ncbi:DNA-binding transcriptional regulator, MocR family, contains an aminotransferase domain [Rhizobiales bacterium GAS188]|nr:DNA-binding transcriptional regulator, MocR family, contains an aminotransferase domain [Rhizobiales bacterium GAS188]
MRENYLSIAEAISADIAAGRLRPGERLPPQRDFAYARKIAVSTASRAYAELVRRGLVTGEVGRGTYVRATPGPLGPALAEPALAPIDLELSFPVLPEQNAELARGLQEMLRVGLPDQALRPIGAAGTAAARETAAHFLARPDWKPAARQILFAGNGRQAIAAALAALAPAGERIGVEAMTYPIVKGIAARLGITLVPLALDEEGLRPDALARAHRATPLRGVYLQPALHNPLGLTMSAARREELATLLADTGLVAVEDAVYSFLADEPPLASLAPAQTILIDSLSKRIAPGLTLGLIAAPARLTDKLAVALRSGAWTAAAFPLAAGLRWMTDGTADRIANAKRRDARERQELAWQEIAREAPAGLVLKGDRRAYHLWLELPDGWRADAFAAAAARQGIAIAPASAFAVSPGHAPNAVRLALASPPLETLRGALQTLRRLAASDAGDSGVE